MTPQLTPGVAEVPHPPTPPSAPAVVLDTNVVLDWRLFANPALDTIGAAIVAGHVRWIACQRMRDELAHVLSRGIPGRTCDPAALLADWDRWARMAPAPQPGARERLHCTDADDQVFIDLAVTARVQWLLTRDRALLKLARRARAFGVHVVPPERWVPAPPELP